MKFLRRGVQTSDPEQLVQGRDSERGDFEARPATKRVMDSSHGSPEPTPVSAASSAVVAAPKSTVSTASSSSTVEKAITMQTPDNVIGETLVVQGRVEFQNLLRIDGHFEGELVGNGSLIIGPTAEVISNLTGLHEVYVEGILIGDCICNKMQIRFAGCVTGNLQCASLGMDPSVVLKGSANVNPRDKTDKAGGKSRSSGARSRQQRSQARAGSDDTASSRASTSALSPESVPLTGSGFDEEKGAHLKQKSRSRGSGDLRDGAEGSVGGHGRGSSSESTASSAMTLGAGDDLLHIPASSASNGTSAAVPKMGDAVNMVRTRPPVYAKSKPSGPGTG